MVDAAVFPDVPWISTVEAPAGVDDVVDSVRAVVAEAPDATLTVAGEKLALVAAGSDDAVMATAPANPFCEVMVTVYAAAEPRAMDWLAGEIWTVNPGFAVCAAANRAPAGSITARKLITAILMILPLARGPFFRSFPNTLTLCPLCGCSWGCGHGCASGGADRPPHPTAD